MHRIIKDIEFRILTLSALTLLSTGVIFYHYIEKLSWLDSTYFCVITLTTIGYGDISPVTPAGKVFTIFYALIGIGILGAFINYAAKRRFDKRLERKNS